jgi:anti-sigma regulatory factor (Ser/Thr protein kinase)
MIRTIEPYHARLPADPDHIAAIRIACEERARQVGFDEDAIGKIGLCVNEAIANVIEHAYKGVHGRPVEIWANAASVDGGPGIEIRVRDWGAGLDPTASHRAPKDPTVPKGLGLLCLRSMMDTLRYEPQSDGGVLLTMTRGLNHQDHMPSADELLPPPENL